jgi:hypothetical protein
MDFDVKFEVTVGTVSYDANGDNTPAEAAMLVIARHGEPGAYVFPADGETTCRVTVEYETRHMSQPDTPETI